MQCEVVKVFLRQWSFVNNFGEPDFTNMLQL